MKILFSMRHFGYLRNFEAVLCRLAERGHDVQIASDNDPIHRDRAVLWQLSQRYPALTFVNVRREKSIWGDLAHDMRAALDYLHYLHPVYEEARKLRSRVEDTTPTLALRLSRLPLLRSRLGVRAMASCLRAMERAVPRSREVERFLARTQPDVVLAGWFGSPQVDYLRSAKSLGIKTGLCVGTWDSLTRKGAMYEMLDLVTVWNEVQKEEAAALHGVPRHRIVVTGAYSFDHWFGWRATPRETFCRKVGLAFDRPYLLYACSSRFVAPQEASFVNTWIGEVRAAREPRLREAGILIRPHPKNAQSWADIRLRGLENVVVWPLDGMNPVEQGAKTDYYDSLYHSAVVIGVKTTAFLEAAIVGRPVATIRVPEFAETQEGTIHFRHLGDVNGGFVHVSNDFEAHLDHLGSVLSRVEPDPSSTNRFVGTFVRPYGRDIPSASRFVEAIEQLGLDLPPRPARTPPWVYAWRTMLFPAAVGMALVHLIAKQRAKGKQMTVARACRRVLFHPQNGVFRLASARAAAARVIDAAFRIDAIQNFTRRHLVPRAMPELREGTGATRALQQRRLGAPEPDGEQLATRAIARLVDRGRPIVVGPWLGEVGFEVLYWIPFLRWAEESAGLDRERVIVVSRGGTAAWYQGLCGTYQDVFDYFPADECYKRHVKQAGLHQKQQRLEAFDQEIIEAVQRSLGIPEVETLHPSLMYELFLPFWRKRASIGLLERITAYGLFPPIRPGAELQTRLPEEYVAVKFYDNDSFPNTAANRSIVEMIISTLTSHSDIVLLDTGLRLDDHVPFPIEDRKRLTRIDSLLTPRNNLALQTEILSRARTFVGTFGGLSFLAPFCGIDTIAVYSHPRRFRAHHLDVARHAFNSLQGGAFVALETNHLELLQGALTWRCSGAPTGSVLRSREAGGE